MVRHNVTVSITPVFSSIEGPETAETNVNNFYSVEFSGGAPTSYDWTVSGAPSTWYGMFANGYISNYISFFQPATYTVNVTICNAYGSDWGNKYVEVISSRGSSPFTVYPNPVNDILYIGIDQPAILAKYAAAGKAAINPTCDIRLYSVMGVQVYKTTTTSNKVQIDVSKLPNGVYFVHLFDGISTYPEVKQVIIKH